MDSNRNTVFKNSSSTRISTKSDINTGDSSSSKNYKELPNEVAYIEPFYKASILSRPTLRVNQFLVNYTFKIVFIGDIYVGKTSIINRFVKNEFKEDYKCSLSAEFSTKIIVLDNIKKAELQIWDTCGQERFKAVTRQYFKDAHAIFLVFDLTDIKTFKSIKIWLDEINDYANSDSQVFLIGNKSDLKDTRKVDKTKIIDFVKKNQKIIEYFEVSASSGENIANCFKKITQKLAKKFGDTINDGIKNMQSHKLKEEVKKNRKKSESESNCC